MTDELFEYGIQNEHSDKRAHVCPVVQRVYVYPTAPAVSHVLGSSYPKKNGFQAGVKGPTARGFLVPPDEIPKCIGIEMRPGVWKCLRFHEDMGLGEKGRRATKLVRGMILQGLFPLPNEANEIADRDLQIRGADIILSVSAMFDRDYVIQVKCDYPGGPKRLGGTGNLFIQTAERNPNGIH